ncbi:NUDIX hydrolase [Flavobacterium succinicans]|uniref:Putative nudix hydrolase NudL n=1 Tax=Flavobacterium succinicans TaxID=29536 RepID=A0A199XRR5_9FLAO|nr:CoA pyrophosphatase [Flavobacterium succinicans]OAZ04325.1 putative nudix hydrolase NudL [Flavobacterium succinicans]
MNFQDFQQYIPQLLEAPLPAFASHIKMAPKERIESLKSFGYADKNPRKAAVLMLLYPKEEQTHLVLIERNSYEGVHSAQIAFPGGKFEKEDLEYETTALRESEEEIGISREQIKIIRPFSPLYIPPSNFLVHPYLGIAKASLQFTLDPKEVASIIELPLSDFLSDALLHETKLTTSYATNIAIPAFKINQHVVWGATAMMLSELKEVLHLVLRKS